MAHKAPHCLAPALPKPHFLCFCFFCFHYTGLPCCLSARHTPASGALHLLSPSPVILFPQILARLTPPLASGLCLNVTSSERPSWTTLQNTSLLYPLHHPLPGPPQPARVGMLSFPSPHCHYMLIRFQDLLSLPFTRTSDPREQGPYLVKPGQGRRVLYLNSECVYGHRNTPHTRAVLPYSPD